MSDFEARRIEEARKRRDDLSYLWRSWMWPEKEERENLIPCYDVTLLDVKDLEAFKRYLRGEGGYRLRRVIGLSKDPREWGLPRVFSVVRTHPKTSTLIPKYRRPGEEKWGFQWGAGMDRAAKRHFNEIKKELKKGKK